MEARCEKRDWESSWLHRVNSHLALEKFPLTQKTSLPPWTDSENCWIKAATAFREPQLWRRVNGEVPSFPDGMQNLASICCWHIILELPPIPASASSSSPPAFLSICLFMLVTCMSLSVPFFSRFTKWFFFHVPRRLFTCLIISLCTFQPLAMSLRDSKSSLCPLAMVSWVAVLHHCNLLLPWHSRGDKEGVLIQLSLSLSF